jgi:phosphatidylglycerophosphate synthase
MEQVLMDKLLGFLRDRQADKKSFFTYLAPFSIHKRWGPALLLPATFRDLSCTVSRARAIKHIRKSRSQTTLRCCCRQSWQLAIMMMCADLASVQIWPVSLKHSALSACLLMSCVRMTRQALQLLRTVAMSAQFGRVTCRQQCNADEVHLTWPFTR